MTSAAILASAARAWPFEQARLVLERIEKKPKAAGAPVIFETGYGPSGLPHIGTFGEVVRTTMVRHAFHVLTDFKVPTKLICVSDDMDGMRKIPDNVPNPGALTPYLQRPLTDVPDPFGTHEGFAQHNNARLRAFLDGFGFEYEFQSATALYRSGVYDETLLKALKAYDAIMAIMIPTLGEERQQTYSPFLPISPTTGRVLYVPMKRIDAAAGTITFDDEDGTETTLPVTGGNVKLQWKPDFGMRWAALGVDFEMYGKDHLTNGVVYSRICKALGAEPPVQFNYELFLDHEGAKISKTKGNGLSVEEWLRYGTPESLSLFMYTKPKTAKRLHFDVIPKAIEEYYAHLAAWPGQSEPDKLENPAWHIHSGSLPTTQRPPVDFSLMINLASVANAETTDILWGFISRYRPGLTPESAPEVAKLAEGAVAYYLDRVKPEKTFRLATDQEAAAFRDLSARMAALPPEARQDGEAIQTEVYTVGKEHGFEPLRDWFKALYEVLLGQSQGPRFGNFVAIYGIPETNALIEKALDGGLV
jgi:lysyl-tRNA synthetase, class I